MNLTKSTVVIYDRSGHEILLEIPTDPPAVNPELKLSRVDEIVDDEADATGDAPAIPVVRMGYVLDVEELPPAVPGTVYIVSRAVLEALQALGVPRPDMIAPDTDRDSVVRNSRGNVIGVRRFRVL
jgi:hypothetical protein